ncbi:MAG: hypothetical protein ACFE0I_24425 [Elainellaceae cyanobacterium]
MPEIVTYQAIHGGQRNYAVFKVRLTCVGQNFLTASHSNDKIRHRLEQTY